jgi:ABC-type glycerol-3-phosphate transport system substrate-binding protein
MQKGDYIFDCSKTSPFGTATLTLHLKILLFIVPLTLCSCIFGASGKVVLWTDRPEFALYSEYFNAAQSKYIVEVQYFESPAQRLAAVGENPDIVAASWINSTATRLLFRPLDALFKKGGLETASFYPLLFSLGRLDKHQYLLPVNFNVPAMVFAQDHSQSCYDPFIIDLEEIKEKGKAFNREARGVYSRIGFSPSSDDEFLFLAATLFGVSFREASPIAWESNALEQSLAWIQSWIAEANTSIQMEDDFAFKYFQDPPDKLINSGRILYTYMDSTRFFTLPEERRTNLDFRWASSRSAIPMDEGSVFYGIHKKAKALDGAKAFTLWFFSAETQKLLLDAEKSKKLNESSFGIAGGFSAMKTVTEQVFPQFYPALIGRTPPELYLFPANVLPRNWSSVKERVILPYLRERIRRTSKEEVRSLERRISDWYRLNRE